MSDYLRIVMELAQTIGILVSLMITTVQLRNATNANKVSVSLQVSSSHREIWGNLFTNPDLTRVLRRDVDLQRDPVTTQEERFVILAINHIAASFDAYEGGLYTLNPDDIARFFDRPIVVEVWKKTKPYQRQEFARYIDNLIGTR